MTATPPAENHPWKSFKSPSDAQKAQKTFAALEYALEDAKRGESRAVMENNFLRREIHAWRKWRENGDAALWAAVAKARKETDRIGAFRCAPEKK